MARGDLSGPGIDGVVEIRTAPGLPFEIGTGGSEDVRVVAGPSLLVAGNYVLDDIRLTAADGATILAASPSSVPIKVVERVIVEQISSRPLSLEEILQRGIVVLRLAPPTPDDPCPADSLPQTRRCVGIAGRDRQQKQRRGVR